MMALRNFLLILTLVLISSGCETLKPETVTPKLIQKRIEIAPHPKKTNLVNVTFYVVTEENFKEFKDKFLKKNQEFVFIAMGMKDYENMSLNMSDIQRYILQQKEIILYYENSINEDNK